MNMTASPNTADLRPPLAVSSRQSRLPHQVAVAFAGGFAAFVDGPDDEALASAAVTGGEHGGDVGGVFSVVGLEVETLVMIQAQLVGNRLLGAFEAQGQEAELGGPLLLGAGNDGERGLLVGVGLGPIELEGLDRAEVAIGVAEELTASSLTRPSLLYASHTSPG